MYSLTEILAIAHLEVSPNEIQALVGTSITFIPLSPALIIIVPTLSWLYCPPALICHIFKQIGL